MNKEIYNQIIDEAYENYINITQKEANDLSEYGDRVNYRPYSKEQFINECKKNPYFSEKWGLKIEERYLNLDERTEWWFEYNKPTRQEKEDVGDSHSGYQEKYFDNVGVPTKLITLTYNNETIESYE